MFENLKQDDAIADETDTLGGGMPDSGAYEAAVDMAYVEESSGGAMGLHLSLATANGGQIRQTIYMTSGKQKGQKNFYIDRQNNKQYLPGFTQAQSLVNLTIGKNLDEMTPEARTIMVYDYDAKKELPTEKQVLTELLTQKIVVGVIKQTVNKNVKNSEGVYVPTAETRDELVIDKFFESGTGCTTVEKKAGLAKGEFLAKWVAKNAGTVRDRTVPVEGGSAPAATEGQATTSLFAS